MAILSPQTGHVHLDAAQDAAQPPRVRPFEPGVAELWDCFVNQQPQGTLFQLIGWKRAIEKTFGYQPHYFYAERGGKITGVVPLFLVSNWIVGRCLISVPFGVYGGICAEDAESEEALLKHLKEVAVSQRVDFLELRNRKGELSAGFHPNPRYATFTTSLLPDLEANLKRLPKDIRYMIRKGEKAGLRTRRGLDQLGDFYRLFAINMRHLGTPVFPRTLFENLVREFSDRIDLLLVYAGSEPVAGAFSFLFRDAMQPHYVGGTPKARTLAANNFLWWELMKYAAQNGVRCFDFGRSKKGTGSYAFKKKWNPQIESLDYQVYLVRRKNPPNFSPTNPKFQLATRLWSRLPLWLANRIGPSVVRWFP